MNANLTASGVCTSMIPEITERDKERFWSKVDKNGPIPQHRPELGPCWVWTACLDKDGYGMFKNKRAHRFAYEIQFGPIPEGMLVCHACDNRKCQRHIWVGSPKDNILDAVSKGRMASGERHFAKTRPYLSVRGERVGGAKLNVQKVSEIRDLCRAKISHTKIAGHFGVSRRLIDQIASNQIWCHVHDSQHEDENQESTWRINGLLTRHESIPRGETNGQAKLTERDVLAILELLKCGKPCNEVANQFNVSFSLISQIKCGKIWTHIPRDPMKYRKNLKPDEIREIVAMVEQGLKYKIICQKFCISASTVSCIKAKYMR